MRKNECSSILSKDDRIFLQFGFGIPDVYPIFLDRFVTCSVLDIKARLLIKLLRRLILLYIEQCPYRFGSSHLRILHEVM